MHFMARNDVTSHSMHKWPGGKCSSPGTRAIATLGCLPFVAILATALNSSGYSLSVKEQNTLESNVIKGHLKFAVGHPLYRDMKMNRLILIIYPCLRLSCGASSQITAQSISPNLLPLDLLPRNW